MFPSMDNLMLKVQHKLMGLLTPTRLAQIKIKQNEEATVLTKSKFVCTDKFHKEDPEYSMVNTNNGLS